MLLRGFDDIGKIKVFETSENIVSKGSAFQIVQIFKIRVKENAIGFVFVTYFEKNIVVNNC